jgi:hypothetical protein
MWKTTKTSGKVSDNTAESGTDYFSNGMNEKTDEAERRSTIKTK